MLLYFLSRIISATGAFVYPAYASYKTLSRRPASEADIERWLMYWSVLGTIVGLEYVAEWIISWIPFYHSFKTIFLLYLALPQTRGASYVYSVHLHPLIAKHEVEIDAALGRIKEEVWRWITLRIRGLWEHVVTGEGTRAVYEGSVGATDVQPETALPMGPTQIAYGLWQTFRPTLTGLLHAPSTPLSPSPSQSQSQSQPLPPAFSRPMTQPPYSHAQPQSQPQARPTRGTTSAIDMHPDAVLLARRRALEAELSALPLPNPHAHDSLPAFPVPQPATSMFPPTLSSMPHPGSSTYLPAFGDERGRYEEIKREDIESDAEGHGSPGDERGGASGGSWGSWWWGGGSRADGYERVKTE